jgi:hypothetical protein
MRALALIIGIDNYPGQKLKNPVNDAEGFFLLSWFHLK